MSAESAAPPESAARAGDAYRVMSDVVRFTVTGEETDGAFTMVEISIPPGGGPPPLHTHPCHESFCVIEGSITIFHEGDTGVVRVEGEPGTVVHVPPGVPHTFRNLSDAPGRVWAVFTPPAMMEAFFTQAGDPHDPEAMPATTAGEAEVARVMEVGERLGMQLFPPPPGVPA
jgi:quercetin dioxygenase-like cupin family protein